MGTVVQIKGKTEQRVGAVISVLQTARKPLTYAEIAAQSGTSYDQLLYILATLVEVGHAERHEVPEGPGRPMVFFNWVKPDSARAVGARKR